MTLQPNTYLQGGKYKIEKVLGQGGFGITYLAEQVNLGRKVAIKEFFMKQFCDRDSATSEVTFGSQGGREEVGRFKQKFIKEAQLISGLENQHIIKVHDIFEENGTAYYIMEYISGDSLDRYIKNHGAMNEIEAIEYIRQIAGALSYIHSRSMNHLDVKPSNILRRGDASVVLIDFGLSKRYDGDGNQTSSTPIGISAGYAPMEQYKRGGMTTFTPTTDIYSLGATLYKCVTGKTPPDANDILEDGLPEFGDNISKSVQQAIEGAMQPMRKKRAQSIAEFLNLLVNHDVADSECTKIIDQPSNIDNNECTILVSDIIKVDLPKKIFKRKDYEDMGMPTDLVIPNDYTSIGTETFYNCDRLTSITIPDTVNIIEDYAFSHCTNLRSIHISDSVTDIGAGAFQFCEHLTSIIIPNSVIYIGEFPFFYCEQLEMVTLSNHLNTIDDDVFYGCKNLKNVEISRLSPIFQKLKTKYGNKINSYQSYY